MIKVSKPSITYLEKDYIQQAVNASDIGVGEFIGRFEQSWADYNSRDYGVSCNSGTNALFLALKALGIGEGDEVIVPEFTMTASAWAVSYTGATPVFVDCLDDLTVDPVLVRQAITKNTKAIMVVPIYGREVSETIYNIAHEYYLWTVEDMAEAHGIQPKGDISCYSFYGNKILTTGEGGMCLTNNLGWAIEMRSLANMYFDHKRTMIHPKMGYNFRMTNIQASIGLAQVERIDEILTKRIEVVSWYDELMPQEYIMPKRSAPWVYDINCDTKQEAVKKHLFDNGVESRYFFKPMSQQPMYLGDYQQLEAYQWSKRGLYLPLYPDMTREEVEHITQCLKTLQ